MATALSPPLAFPQAPEARLLTAADVAILPEELPSGPVRYELDNGKLVIMAPPGAEHSGPQVRVTSDLFTRGEQAGHGRAFVEIGIILWRGPDRVVGADAAFVPNSSLPARVSKEGYLETIPDLVVEVRSKNDSTPEILSKVADYHRAGVKVVWVLDPEKRAVTVYPNGGASQTLDAAATLTAEPIIPGFQVAVSSFFG